MLQEDKKTTRMTVTMTPGSDNVVDQYDPGSHDHCFAAANSGGKMMMLKDARGGRPVRKEALKRRQAGCIDHKERSCWA